jgi:hypothetical protein
LRCWCRLCGHKCIFLFLSTIFGSPCDG